MGKEGWSASPGKAGRPVQFADALVLIRRHEDGDVAVVALDADRAALSGVEEFGEVLLGLGGGDLVHGDRLPRK